MKKIFLLIAAIVPMLLATSCNDDDDLPDVNFTVDITGGQFIDDQIYVVAGDTLTIDSVGVVNNEAGKAAVITYANYYWDYQFLGQNAIPPFGFELYVGESATIGKHLLEIYAPVYAVDKSPAFAIYAVVVNVVSSSDEIPTEGKFHYVIKPTIQLNDPSK